MNGIEALAYALSPAHLGGIKSPTPVDIREGLAFHGFDVLPIPDPEQVHLHVAEVERESFTICDGALTDEDCSYAFTWRVTGTLPSGEEFDRYACSRHLSKVVNDYLPTN